MAFYEGKLEKISGGHAAYRRGTRVREFVDIDGQRLKKVVLPPYRDELLREAVGERVALSIYARRRSKYVQGIRTPKGGVDKDSLVRVVALLIMGMFAAVFVALLFGVFVAMVISVAIGGNYGLAVGAAVALAILISPFVVAVKQFRAWAAL